MSDTKKCISCGAELDEKALFCPSCGAKQEEIKINKIQRKPRPKVKVDIDDETVFFREFVRLILMMKH